MNLLKHIIKYMQRDDIDAKFILKILIEKCINLKKTRHDLICDA